MKISVLILGIALASGAVAAANAQAQAQHTVVLSQNVKWAPTPAAFGIPPGAQAAVLYGDPGKSGEFALRLKLPKGYTIAPHTHPQAEIVTVISGTVRLGTGSKADPTKGQAVPKDGFFAIPPGMAHYAVADAKTVLQVNGVGPWVITYVNPKDDPRHKK